MQVEIPTDCQRINVLFSGGADSSLLAYLLIKQNPDTPIVLHFMKHRLDFQSPYMINCHAWLEQHFNKKIQLNWWGKVFIRQAVEMILIDFPGYVYSGCNKVPENVFIPTVLIPNDTPPVRGPAYNEFHKRPFIEILKPELYKIYKEENILELFNLTFSCGAPKKDKNEKHIPCGGCFFCMERQWAIQS
jgi:7-cyano-7-deazaguanine synthase in queuosine biosynthesis